MHVMHLNEHDLCYLIFPTRKVWTMYGAKSLQNFCELAVCVGLFIN